MVAMCGMLASSCQRDSGAEKPALPTLDAVPPGAHDIVRLQYNDTNDIYRAFVVGGDAKTPLRLRNVRLALLTDEQLAAGKKPHLVDDGAGPVVFSGTRFKIGILHGVVERRVIDGKPRNVVVRTERKSWAPFLVPQLVDGKSVWLTPAVHYPPPLGAGAIVGSGGSGPTRESAWDDHRRRHGMLPQAVHLEFEGYVLAKDLAKELANDDVDDGDDAPSVDAGTAAVPHPAGGASGPKHGRNNMRRQMLNDIPRPVAPIKKTTATKTAPVKKTTP